MAFYSDPNFMARMQQMRSPGQTFGGPFASTRNAVAQRLQMQANRGLQNQIAQTGAGFRRDQAQFDDRQRWGEWGGRIQRAANDINARTAINHQRRMQYEQEKAKKKARRRGIIGGALGALGTVGGAVLGTMVMPGVGTSIGAGLGGQLGGSSANW
jgi:hypothetical protein